MQLAPSSSQKKLLLYLKNYINSLDLEYWSEETDVIPQKLCKCLPSQGKKYTSKFMQMASNSRRGETDFIPQKLCKWPQVSQKNKFYTSARADQHLRLPYVLT